MPIIVPKEPLKYSFDSRKRLETLHPDLQRICTRVLELGWDHSIIWGHRGEQDQNMAYATGKSKLQWPNSKHNTTPSLAVDIAPWPINWGDERRFILFAGVMLATAQELGIKLVWGGNFKHLNTFILSNDLGHFELVP